MSCWCTTIVFVSYFIISPGRIKPVHTISLNGATLYLDGAQLDRQDIEIVEGDIAFPKGTVPHAENRNAYVKAAKWANGIIPYEIDRFSSYSAGQINIITASMRKLESQTNNCIRFVQRTSQPTWIRIYDGSGCWSYMGRQYSSGSQDVSIDKNGCVSQSIVIHELLHTVGFAHEQSRPDRDSSVAVQWTNIQNGQSNNFQSFVNGESSTLNQPYDLGSIMHYKWNAFSKNGQPTLLPTSATVPKEIMGAAKEMITLDIRKVKQYYNCQ